MLQKEDLTGVSISLDIDEKQCLFISLTSDGSIQRMGSAQAGEDSLDLYLGQVSDSLFSHLVQVMPNDFLTTTGTYNVGVDQGSPVKLSIVMSAGTQTDSLEFNFGMQSTGIPSEVMDFVREARSLTEDWFQAQQKISSVGE